MKPPRTLFLLEDLPPPEWSSEFIETAEATTRKQEFGKRWAKVDVDAAWACCGRTDAVEDAFLQRLYRIMHFYEAQPSHTIEPPTYQEKKRLAHKLSKHAQALQELVCVSPSERSLLLMELNGEYIDHAMQSPDVPDEIADEGGAWTYLDDRIAQLSSILTELQTVLARWLENSQVPRGRRPSNPSLTDTLVDLAHLYQNAAALHPLKGFYSDPTRPDAPFDGPFFRFTSQILWAFNGREFPMNGALGEAIRYALSEKT